MKRLFNIFLLFSLSTLLLFSCAEVETIKKRKLTYPELEITLNKNKSFQLFIESVREMENNMILKAEKIGKVESKWINTMYDRFPSLEEFLSQSSPSSVEKFTHITGLDIQHGIDDLTQKYIAFSQPLYQNYTFEEEDLTQIILSKSEGVSSLEKSSSGTCETYCAEGANEEYHRVENQCEEESGTYCRARAIMAKKYFERGCMRGCRYE